MSSRLRNVKSGFLCGCVCAAVASPAQILDLGSGSPVGINNLGQVALATGSGCSIYSISTGVSTPIPNPSAGTFAPTGLNDELAICGRAGSFACLYFNRAFLFKPVLGGSSWANGIASDRTIAGRIFQGGLSYAAAWPKAGPLITPLGTPSDGSVLSGAMDVSASGATVGYQIIGTGSPKAFKAGGTIKWVASGIARKISSVRPGDPESKEYVVGESYSSNTSPKLPFIYDTAFHLLPLPQGALSGTCRGVNSHGIAVGSVNLTTGSLACAWTQVKPGQWSFIDLTAIEADPLWKLSAAVSINEDGMIVGVGTHGGPRAFACHLIPNPWGARSRIYLSPNVASRWATGVEVQGADQGKPYRDDYLTAVVNNTSKGKQLLLASQVQYLSDGTLTVLPANRLSLSDVSSINQAATPAYARPSALDMYVSKGSSTALALISTGGPFYAGSSWGMRRYQFHPKNSTLYVPADGRYYLDPFSQPANTFPIYAIPRVQGVVGNSDFAKIILDLSASNKVPCQVTAGVLWQECRWHQFQKPGDTIPGIQAIGQDLADSSAMGSASYLVGGTSFSDSGTLVTLDGGIGAGQVTGGTCFLNLPTLPFDADDKMLTQLYGLASDARYNVTRAVARVVKTYTQDGTDSILGLKKSPEFIEPWLLNISRYNGTLKNVSYRSSITQWIEKAPWVSAGGGAIPPALSGVTGASTTDGAHGYGSFDNKLSESLTLALAGNVVTVHIAGAVAPDQGTISYVPIGTTAAVTQSLQFDGATWTCTLNSSPAYGPLVTQFKIGGKTYVSAWGELARIDSVTGPGTLSKGSTGAVHVTLKKPGPASQVIMNISCSKPSLLTVPKTCTVVNGTANFSVVAPTSSGVTTPTSVTISLTPQDGGDGASLNVTITP